MLRGISNNHDNLVSDSPGLVMRPRRIMRAVAGAVGNVRIYTFAIMLLR
jgi:hypothetical protein